MRILALKTHIICQCFQCLMLNAAAILYRGGQANLSTITLPMFLPIISQPAPNLAALLRDNQQLSAGFNFEPTL